MKVETARKRILAMAWRWERDQEALQRMFPSIDWEDSSNAVEMLRNLSTALEYADRFIAMTDLGVQRELDHHKVASSELSRPQDRGDQ